MNSFFPSCLDGNLRLGLGGAALGNLFSVVSDAQSQALLEAAWASGCRSFDTAPHYGHGRSERRLGDALRPHVRDSYALSSKVGRLLTPNPDAAREQHGYVDVLPFDQHWDYSAAGTRRSIEDSLQRLGLASLDVVYVHDLDRANHGEQAPAVLRQVIEETLPTLQQLKHEGLIRAVGLGVNDTQVVLDVLRHADLDALLLAGRYSLLDHSALPELLPLCLQRGVRIALGGVFNSGILATGTQNGQATFNYAPASGDWLDRTRQIEAICAIHDVPLRAAALQFAAAHAAVDIVMLGARHVAEWEDGLAMMRHPIPSTFWQALREARLLPDAAPTPGGAA
ncbi:D-threo-aldose 1-dehydrogenase [Polaromonas sp. OV174]|uniref:aldo/keto reductase n=1 Tax=Polaromonas sp. OV174 TaxID=1855300 RepID=UPI0008E03780|nr:aldo/keto reductase [Polaromonas sp. OV174]SFB72933.1 D-threo-aldose 1-dehydrogenase [Polaromonas sp. OV174]